MNKANAPLMVPAGCFQSFKSVGWNKRAEFQFDYFYSLISGAIKERSSVCADESAEEKVIHSPLRGMFSLNFIFKCQLDFDSNSVQLEMVGLMSAGKGQESKYIT